MAAVGDRVGDYELEAELGQGGMATVYRAKHVLLDTQHAVKVLDPELRANSNARQRFLDEAKLQAKHLDHPGIVKVTNIVATADHAALVMELVDGKSLESEIGTLSDQPDEVRRIMIALLDAVGHAHDKGVVHRDLKPANVLLAGAKRLPKVTDFGIAKASRPDGAAPHKKSTHHDARMGTLSYMSPEQVRSAKDVTARSDIWSLGAILYELSTGKLAFDAENEFDVMSKIVNASYVPPAKLKPGLDPTIVSVIERALQIDPAKRFQSCAEMGDALRGSAMSAIRIGVKPPETKPPEIQPPTTPTKSGKGRWIALAVLVLGGAGAGAAYYLTQMRPEGLSGPPASALAEYTKDLDGTGPVVARIETSEGVITCTLAVKETPRTVANFVGLATGKQPWLDPTTKKVMRGVPFYDGKRFHQVDGGYQIRTGAPPGNEDGGPGYSIPHEPSTLTHEAGTLAMWSVGLDNGSQFRIYERKAPSNLDATETMFGTCKNLDVVAKISGKDANTVTVKSIVIMNADGTARSTGKSDPAKVYAVTVDNAPSRGMSAALVTLVTAVDYTDSHSHKSLGMLAELQRIYGVDLRVVHKDFVMRPDVSMVPALASCAAHQMGAWAEMDTALWGAFEAKRPLDRSLALASGGLTRCWLVEPGCSTVVEMAKNLGLDVEQFKRHMRETCVSRVDVDLAELKGFGVNETPAFFINGRYISGTQPLAAVKALIDEQLALAKSRVSNGTDATIYYDRWVIGMGFKSNN